MAIHVRSAQGMGTSTITGSTVVNTGMGVEDHMHFSQDFLVSGGVLDPNHFVVTQNGTPNMTVLTGTGTVYIPNASYADGSTAQNKYWSAINDGVITTTINSNSSGNPRITSIFARFDTGATPDANATNLVTITAVDGTPAASPTAPATPNNCERLANITVANGASSIVTANIADARKFLSVAPVNSPAGFLINGQITRTVASNAITLSVVTLNGETPSVSNPVSIRIANGIRKITYALTLTINQSTTNRFNAGGSMLTGREIDYFVYLVWHSSSNLVRLAFARIPNARVWGDFSGSSTSEKYAEINTGTPASTDDVEVVGRFNATLTFSTPNYNWSVPATSVIINKPIYDTKVLVFLPTYGAGGSMTYTSSAIGTYKISGSTCTANVASTGTTGGSASTEITWTLPITPIASNYPVAANNVGVGSFVTGNMFVNSNYVSCYRYDRGLHGIGANAYLYGSVTYEIL